MSDLEKFSNDDEDQKETGSNFFKTKNISEIQSNNSNFSKIDLDSSSAAKDHRGQWSSGVEFLLSCISMSVGLGNVWRFPYVAYENGGGAFLIPYFLLLFLIGRPLYYLELILGQFSGRGPIKVWKCVPAIKGLGFAQLLSTAYISIFYNYLMGISIYYLIVSFSPELPWTNCNETIIDQQNISCSQYYYETWEITTINYRLVLCLIASWILVYFSLIKGITSLGKVAYFTAIFPYVILMTLLIVSLTQEGALNGILYFFRPNFQKLLDPIVWYRAVEQSFFSLAVCFGSLIMYSSYNNFSNNVGRDAIIISVLDTFTSLLAGCVIFAVLGSMSFQKGIDIKDVVSKGEGLAFIVYPEGLSKIHVVPQLWSILFFFMLFILGIGSSVAMIETILTSIKDEFESLHKNKAKLAAVFCFIFMILGLPLTTDAGSYILMLLDNYGVGTAAFLYGIIEVLAITRIYGLTNFIDDVEFMLKSKLSSFWKLTWGFVTPFILILIFVYGNILLILDDNQKPGIPYWGNAIGWFLAGSALLQIPLWMIITIAKQDGSLIERIHSALQSSKDWGPIDETTFNQWTNYKVERTFNKIFKSIDSNNEPYLISLERRKGADNLAFVPE
ncbi:Sodium-dependent nutrient amino acid transporter 1 [Sarcoptes scabiei]|uniref:Transporter n=1 Tax=Sarcoptes scabiei TaxID=52283 RepID=A0A834VAN9_SARSC|nr:Sodium-dependent nutrient amino acid transporter 1 [Sarcoptes scabiei]